MKWIKQNWMIIVNINNSIIILEKNNKVYAWNEWIALNKDERYNLLQIYGPGHWRVS